MAKKVRIPAYPLKNSVTMILSQLVGAECWAELPFHSSRKWRFDYAFPAYKVAIEVDGGVYTGGRHSGGKGQVNDMEKLNAAAVLGWRVLRYTPDQFASLGRVSDDVRACAGMNFQIK